MQLFSHSKLEKRSYLRMHPFFRKLQKFSIVSLSKDFRLIKKFITPGGVESCTTLVHITSAFTICFLLCCASGAAHDSRQIYAHTQFQLTVTWYNSYTNYSTGSPQISWLPISIYHCILQPVLPYLCLPRFISKAKSVLQSGKFFRMQFKSHISKCKGCTLLKSRRRLRLECYCGPHAFLPSELKLTHKKNEKT